ncbi:hypothetical protein V1525DRAFT_398129 [Lipomyces kononenkoae]|uniref:Uncharacterized protein n=1 Tax=Lipomyces kononenkoae TaxID=34357 RepID=A0ACC3T711_LIPKO
MCSQTVIGYFVFFFFSLFLFCRFPFLFSFFPSFLFFSLFPFWFFVNLIACVMLS